METKMVMLTIIALAILFIITSFCIGYIQGFKKSKKIDDKIIDELRDKYNT